METYCLTEELVLVSCITEFCLATVDRLREEFYYDINLDWLYDKAIGIVRENPADIGPDL